MKNFLRRTLRDVLSEPARRAFAQILKRDKNVQQVFSEIYRQGSWGKGTDSFYSGSGSHDLSIVAPYVDAVRAYLQQLPKPIKLVDLGCGDFNVGKQLVEDVDIYVGCDIVPELIEHNRLAFKKCGLRFHTINAVTDALPAGDIVCIRQVLQHLDNTQINSIVAKLHQYKHWVITEHISSKPDFTPNVDKPADEKTRLTADSGVILTAPPFNIKPSRELVLCEAREYGGIVRTTVYQF